MGRACIILVFRGPAELLVALALLEGLVYTFVFAWVTSHVMLMLIVLELFTLKAFFVVSARLASSGVEVAAVFMFLAIMAREAGFGIALLTAVARAHGNDIVSLGAPGI